MDQDRRHLAQRRQREVRVDAAHYRGSKSGPRRSCPSASSYRRSRTRPPPSSPARWCRRTARSGSPARECPRRGDRCCAASHRRSEAPRERCPARRPSASDRSAHWAPETCRAACGRDGRHAGAPDPDPPSALTAVAADPTNADATSSATAARFDTYIAASEPTSGPSKNLLKSPNPPAGLAFANAGAQPPPPNRLPHPTSRTSIPRRPCPGLVSRTRSRRWAMSRARLIRRWRHWAPRAAAATTEPLVDPGATTECLVHPAATTERLVRTAG
jgi:hypothetical protein